MTNYASFNQWQAEVAHEIYITEGYLLEECPSFDWWVYFNNGFSPDYAISQYFKCREPTTNELTA